MCGERKRLSLCLLHLAEAVDPQWQIPIAHLVVQNSPQSVTSLGILLKCLPRGGPSPRLALSGTYSISCYGVVEKELLASSTASLLSLSHALSIPVWTSALRRAEKTRDFSLSL